MRSNETELIEKLLQGDENAFRHAVREYQGSMHNLARSIAGDNNADEIVQDAWLSVLKALPKFEGRSSLKTWILTIVHNAALSRLRKDARNILMGDALDIEQATLPSERFAGDGHWAIPPRTWHGDTPESLMASEQLREKIHTAISNLPPAQQTILTLRDMEGMSMEEICKILDITESNSRVLLHRARARIWQVIEKFENG